MSYIKAAELLDLAMEIAAQRLGMTYSTMDNRSTAPTPEGRRRNTQRLVKALERVFGDRVTTAINEVGEKVVYLKGDGLRQLMDLTPLEMTALDHAIATLGIANATADADALRTLRAKIRLLVPERRMISIDVDYEALLRGSHVAVRSGPSPHIDPAVMQPLTEALLALRQVEFDYAGMNRTVRRTAHPYGVIFGHRAYLVALVDGASGNNPSRWRMDRIENVAVLDAPSFQPEEFNLDLYARRAFGGFHNESEYGEVEWRFSAEVAENVRGFRFHPDQEILEEADGTVTVRFCASGHLEMAWALYPWGDSVDVIRPEPVRKLVEGYRRRDFPGVP